VPVVPEVHLEKHLVLERDAHLLHPLLAAHTRAAAGARGTNEHAYAEAAARAGGAEGLTALGHQAVGEAKAVALAGQRAADGLELKRQLERAHDRARRAVLAADDERAWLGLG
jgi:hypothetical protein